MTVGAHIINCVNTTIEYDYYHNPHTYMGIIAHSSKIITILNAVIAGQKYGIRILESVIITLANISIASPPKSKMKLIQWSLIITKYRGPQIIVISNRSF